MFERFFTHFTLLPRGQSIGSVWRNPRLTAIRGYEYLAARAAGCSFDDGIYRFHDASSGPRAEQWIAESFPHLAVESCPFAYDWLGRQFAVDGRRMRAGEPLILLFEPGTDEALEIPTTFEELHNAELVDYSDSALAIPFYAQWRESTGDRLPIASEQCVGYRTPLFLGGADSVANLELIDLDVYWSLSAQIKQQVRNVAPETSITKVESS